MTGPELSIALKLKSLRERWQERTCPYPPGSTEAFSWCSGFIEGDAKRQGYSYSRGARQ